MIQCWLRRRKIPFSLNKSNTQHPRPIAIKFQFYFCFVLHTHCPTHMMSFQILSEFCLMGAHTLSKRAYQIPCSCNATGHSLYQPTARSQACSAALGRKQVREWILLFSCLQFKQDFRCCRTFQTSECSRL